MASFFKGTKRTLRSRIRALQQFLRTVESLHCTKVSQHRTCNQNYATTNSLRLLNTMFQAARLSPADRTTGRS